MKYSKYLYIKNNTAHLDSAKTLKNVYISCQGVIIKSGIISRYSSLFSRISLARILKTYFSYLIGYNVETIDNAIFIPRHIVDQGTYGDYILELLLPLTNNLLELNSVLLIDSDFNEKYGINDLDYLGVEHHRIPLNGYYVKNLTVLNPCQYFDHFNKNNLKKLTKAFPLDPTLENSRTGKIYLSRSGVKTHNQKQVRSIQNESELERVLKSIGFEIIYPHLMENVAIRAKLSDAHTVVGPAGSAFIHLAWGKPKDIVEIASVECWNPTWVYLSHAMQSLSHTVVMAENGNIEISKVIEVLKKEL